MELLSKLLSRLEFVWSFLGAGLVGAGLQLLRSPEMSKRRRAYEALSAIVVAVICGLVVSDLLPNKPALIIATALAASLSGGKIIDWLHDKGVASIMEALVGRFLKKDGDSSATQTTNVNVTVGTGHDAQSPASTATQSNQSTTPAITTGSSTNPAVNP